MNKRKLAGGTKKQLMHFAQLSIKEDFEGYDYGES
jgi:hypothetical protein